MCCLASRERICADDSGMLVLPDDEISGCEGAADRTHGRERQAQDMRQGLYAGAFSCLSKGGENGLSHRILLRAQSRVAESFCDALIFFPQVFVHDVSSRASR